MGSRIHNGNGQYGAPRMGVGFGRNDEMYSSHSHSTQRRHHGRNWNNNGGRSYYNHGQNTVAARSNHANPQFRHPPRLIRGYASEGSSEDDEDMERAWRSANRDRHKKLISFPRSVSRTREPVSNDQDSSKPSSSGTVVTFASDEPTEDSCNPFKDPRIIPVLGFKCMVCAVVCMSVEDMHMHKRTLHHIHRTQQYWKAMDPTNSSS